MRAAWFLLAQVVCPQRATRGWSAGVGGGITPIHSVTSFICRAALMYRLWLEAIRHGGGAAGLPVGRGVGVAGLEIIMLVKWNPPLESTAKVKGRNERSNWFWRREVGAVLVFWCCWSF